MSDVPLHVTFVCSGNICRSPMAEKMFAHQISERGLADVVRVTSAGTGNWHDGDGADRRASQVLREHGYPTAAPRRPGRRRPPGGRPGRRAGPQPPPDAAAELGVPRRPGADAALVRPALGRARPRRRGPVLRHPDEFEDVLRRDRGGAARPARLGRRATCAERGRRPADAQPWAFLLRAAVAGGRTSWSWRSPTCVSPCWRRGSWARTPRPPGRTTRSRTRCRRPDAADVGSAATGFVGTRRSSGSRVTATGHYLPEAQVLARLRVDRRRPGVRGAGAVRGRRRPDRAGRPRLRPTRCRARKVPAIAAPPTGTVTITARLRDSETGPAGKAPFRRGRCQQVYSINTAQVSSVTGVPLAGSYLQLVDGSARRSRRDPAAAPRCRPVPVLRHPVDRVRHHRADRAGLLHLFRDQGAPAGDARPRRGDAATRTPVTVEEKLADRYGRGTDASPRRSRGQPAEPPATAAPRARRSPTSGARPSPSVGRISSSWRVLRRPAEAHTERTGERRLDDTGVGLGCLRASRRQARSAAARRPADHRRADHDQHPGQPGRRR